MVVLELEFLMLIDSFFLSLSLNGHIYQWSWYGASIDGLKLVGYSDDGTGMGR